MHKSLSVCAKGVILHRVLLMVKARRVAIASQKSRSAFSPALFGEDLAIRIAINNQNNHPKKTCKTSRQ